MKKKRLRMRGQEGRVRVRKREASDRHEGLRVVVLRQLAGARRGIEIANAHYGYFPIEGRIPLASPLLLSFLSLASSSSRTSPFRARIRTYTRTHSTPVLWLSQYRSVHLLLSSRARYSVSFAFYLAHPSLSFRSFRPLPLCPFHLARLTPRGLQIPDAMYAYPLAIILVQVILTMKANVLLFPLLINGH